MTDQLNEKFDQSSKIIISKKGKIKKKGNEFSLILYNGSIINSKEEKFYNFI